MAQPSANQAPPSVATGPLPPAAVITTLLPGQMIYCRWPDFQPAKGWGDVENQLETWVSQGAQGIILDLRSNRATGDFQGAAQVASFFTPAGATLFTVKNGASSQAYVSASPIPGADPVLITEPMTVLIDQQTTGAAEALAASLRSNGALIIGDKKDGAQEPPSASSEQILLGNGTPLLRQPLMPDIALSVAGSSEAAVLSLIDQNKVSDVIREADASHRLSEAALVRGEDPEIDAYLAPRTGKGLAVPEGPQDVVLVAALDSLKAIRLSQRPLPTSAPPDDFRASPSVVQ